VAEMVSKDREEPYKGPAIRMQMSKGHVDLCKKRALEPRKGEAESEPLENCGVHEKERLVRIRAIVSTHGNAYPTRQKPLGTRRVPFQRHGTCHGIFPACTYQCP